MMFLLLCSLGCQVSELLENSDSHTCRLDLLSPLAERSVFAKLTSRERREPVRGLDLPSHSQNWTLGLQLLSFLV